jgi:acyl-coenzyme A thioesterase PaaI-like protein
MEATTLSVERLQEISDSVFAEWVRGLGFKVTSASQHEVHLWLPFSQSLSHVPNAVSGQALLALADSAMVLALASFYGQFKPVATVDLHMQFMKVAKGNVRCRASVERATKSIAFATASFFLEDGQSNEIGRAIGTFSIPVV